MKLRWNERLDRYGFESREAAIAAAPRDARIVSYVLPGRRQRWAIAIVDSRIAA
jgi:hypothetical protein